MVLRKTSQYQRIQDIEVNNKETVVENSNPLKNMHGI